jgi:dienelactone hydrolase
MDPEASLVNVLVEGPNGPLRGLLATPPVPRDGGWKAGVVVVPDRSGIDPRVCRALAAAGHGAIALDLDVGDVGGAPGLERCTASVAAALAFLRGATPTAPPRLGVIGYGAGGLVALAAGVRCQVGASVSFYGEGPTLLRARLAQIVDRPKRHAATLLCLVGGKDEGVTPADLGAIRDHLDAFGMRHTLIVYPRTRGGFCEEGAPTYRADEANDAWQKALHAIETAPRLRHRFVGKRAPVGGAALPAPAPAPVRRG